MKFIAHRGACLECQEDTLAALIKGAQYSAFAVECDPRPTKDNRYVIFHDNDLKRLAGKDVCVKDITYEQMKGILRKAGKSLTTLDELISDYTGGCAVLLDLSFEATNEDFYRYVKSAPFRVIVGVHRVEEAKIASRFFGKQDILAFMPNPNMVDDFVNAGAGIVRLWENWVNEARLIYYGEKQADYCVEEKRCSIADIRRRLPKDCEIWIMSYDKAQSTHPLYSMNGSKKHIDCLSALGVDGILLNDIKMAMSQ